VKIVITLDWNRILSGSLAAIYILISLVAGGLEGAFIVALFTITPLACIWFSDAMGDYTGPTNSMAITQTSPGIFVCIAGWILLLMPIIAAMLRL
jgi:hypothetical protein